MSRKRVLWKPARTLTPKRIIRVRSIDVRRRLSDPPLFLLVLLT